MNAERTLGASQCARLLGDWSGSGAAYARLAGRFEQLVSEGQLPIGVRLPAERDLAARLHLSRATVSSAYARLREREVIQSRQGAGSWTRQVPGALPPRTLAADPDAVIDLGVASPGGPPALMTDALVAASARMSPYLRSHGLYAAGLPELRSLIAARFTRRGLPTSADHVLVTTGATGGIHLLANQLLRPHHTVLVENPTYPNARQTLLATGARAVPVGVGPHGWDVEAVVRTLRDVRPRLAYLLPDHHNPTGQVLDENGRSAIMSAAAAVGATVIVDETMVDVRLVGPDLPPPMARFSTQVPAITVGSLSKTYWGGLRLGWVRAPRSVITELVRAKSSFDLGASVIDQMVAVELLEQEETMLPRQLATFLAQRDALVDGLQEALPDWTVPRPSGGLSLWLKPPVAVDALVERAHGLGLRLLPGSVFGLDGTLDAYLRIPYALGVDELREAVARIAAAVAEPVATRWSRPTDSLIA